MIRLLAFDLDGTTITEHKYLSSANRQALIRAGEKGVILVPATGRMLRFLPEEITSLPGVRYVITSNGAAVYDLSTGQPVIQKLIPNEKACQVQALLEEYDIYVEYYRNGGAITKTGNPERAFTHFGLPESKFHFIRDKEYSFTDDLGAMLHSTGLCPEKINLPHLSEELWLEIRTRLSALGGLRLVTSLPGNLEINSEEAHKGAALLELGELLGVSEREMMAVGDNGNDVTMLQAVFCSVAVADGAEEAKRAARYLTGPHDEDGLAQAVKEHILQGPLAFS